MHKISFQMPKEPLGMSLLFNHIFQKMSHNVQGLYHSIQLCLKE
jgi:hypothetical protein